MRRNLVIVSLVILTCMLSSPVLAERSVVLVTNDECTMESISLLDVRKAYFGIAVSYQGTSVRAFRLNNDDELNSIFLQTVAAMSQRSYEERVRLMLLKYGTPRPREFDSVGALAAALRRYDCSIAYMWLDDLVPETGLRRIRLLWQGD